MESVHLLLTYKNFAANSNISHIGLGVSALNNAKVLNKHNIQTDVLPIVNAAALSARLRSDPSISHVVISAPWIPSEKLAEITMAFPRVKFTVNCHSNVGFLQADTNAAKLLKQYIELEQGTWNFHVAGNSEKFVQWMRAAFKAPCTYLPNMYALDYSTETSKPLWNGGVLRIGAFGATRPQKNIMSAAGAAIQIHEDLKADTELWISGGRAEGGATTILTSLRALCDGIPGFKLVTAPWATWPQFRALIRKMNLLLQVSYTESFNMVTGDGVAVGVPTVTSDAIDWVPDYWKAHFDDVVDIARVGRQLISDPMAAADGLYSLEHHNRESFAGWVDYLGLGSGYQYDMLIRTSARNHSRK